MSDILVKPYIPMLLSRFRNYRKLDNNKWACSCPVCGDSKRNTQKARGGVYVYKNKYFYNCFRCGVSMPFTAFLKQQDSNLYSQYIMETFGTRKNHKFPDEIKTQQPVFVKNDIPDSWINLTDLNNEHPAKKYIMDRKIPHIDRLYYVDDFQKMVNEIIPDKYKTPRIESRIIIPMINKAGELLKFQGRSLEPDAKIRYITIDLNSHNQNFFWEKHLNRLKTVYVTEGPFDAMFIDNCISVAGSALEVVKDRFRKVVLIFDNEPRSKIIMNKVEKAINDGFTVLIWNDAVNGKDVNEMILNDSNLDINKYVESRTFSGMKAKLELTKHRKVK